MTGGPLSVTCPVCRKAYPVPTELVGVDWARHRVLVSLDRSGLYGHLAECARSHPLPEPEAAPMHQAVTAHPTVGEVAVRTDHFLSQGAFMVKGNRACTMCGTFNEACMKGLKVRAKSCCRVCGDGNTHSAPGEDRGSCAEWAAGAQA